MFKRSSHPLASLKYLGTICPCLEKEEDGPARKAAWTLSAAPIRWHRKLRSASSPKADASRGVSGFLSGMFSGGASDSAHYGALEGSTLSVIDSIKGPSLMIRPPSNDVDCKCIPLKIIKTIQIPSGVVDSLVGSRSAIQVLDKSGRELLRFDLLQPATASVPESEWQDVQGEGAVSSREDADEKTRDELIDQLEILVEWERRRQDYLITMGEEDDNKEDVDIDEYDDGPTIERSSSKSGNVITDKARKIQHFAQREIEMQKTKREREARKAKYVKEAGGLKYTAIAMANRS
ncbi:hypothetical protein ACHAW6_007097 [Cyclotella cf. meneghiniana]